MRYTRTGTVLISGLAMLGLAACGGGNSGSGASSHPAKPPASKSSAAKPGSAKPAKGHAAGAAFGPACTNIPRTGPASAKSMAAAPVATAASHNPMLSQLTGAIKKAGLTDTLNKAKHITVFAPEDAAFKKVPKAQLTKLMQNKQQLTKLLEGHVVKQQITPDQLAKGKFKSMAGTSITSSGKPPKVTVDQTAHIGCGNVKTANATVYIIDGVLMPKK